MSIACIVMTGSRTGIVGLCAVGVLVWLKSTNKFRWMLVLIASVAVTWNVMPQEEAYSY